MGGAHDAARAGDGAHQMVELRFDGGQIGEDVGVVVFQVVQDGGARAVMDKLRTLVEEGRVVFVRLDHEGTARGVVAGRHVQVRRHAADQEVGRQARGFQYPGQHRAGGGLAMRARHCQHVRARQDVVAQPLRAGHVARAGFQNGFHQRVAAADHVADHVQVGRKRHLFGAKAFDQLDALFG
ncbi:hypothetical protein D3C71_1443890 [compost metagenome]